MKIITSIRGVNSSFDEISYGVPQGSILGPILFMLLINDLPYASECFPILFGDDTTLQFSSINLQHLHSPANVELAKIAEWVKKIN